MGLTKNFRREGAAVIRYVVALGLGYVLGTKAGRRRYEQIVGTYRALTGSPVAKSIIEAGRRKLASRVSPDAGFVTLTEIDPQTGVVGWQPKRAPRGNSYRLTRSDRRR
jgi:hypothetical protein